MKYLTLFIAALFLTACTQPIDFGLAQFFEVQEVLESKNCEADCDEEADCEGERAKIVGIIDESGISEDNYMFFVNDRNEPGIDIEVRVDTMIAPVLFAAITDKGGLQVLIEGLLEGVEGTASSNCQREIFINIANVDDVQVVE